MRLSTGSFSSDEFDYSDPTTAAASYDVARHFSSVYPYGHHAFLGANRHGHAFLGGTNAAGGLRSIALARPECCGGNGTRTEGFEARSEANTATRHNAAPPAGTCREAADHCFPIDIRRSSRRHRR